MAAPRRSTDATKATPSARARARESQPAWCARFLDGLSEAGSVRGGAERAGIHRATAYKRRAVDAKFAAAWAEAEEGVVERLEETALSLALDGEVRLIEFLLKARRPDVYRENVRLEHSGPEGGPIAAETTIVDKRKRSDAARQYLATIAED